ncbi:MAG: metal-dependent hydrolase [Bacteroidales bacterium]|nr:metal-dependent hydrolase [Bacteroidales bacterium]
MRKASWTIAILLSVLVGFTCHKEPEEGGGGEAGSIGDPISVVNGTVRFYVQRDAAGTRGAMGLPTGDFMGYSVRVNGLSYPISTDAAGNAYCDVDAADGNTYSAVLMATQSSYWLGSTSGRDVFLPYSQFRDRTVPAMRSFPQYAEYSVSTGNVLKFRDGFSLLDLSVTGSGIIASARVRSLDAAKLAGKGSYTPSKGISISEGTDYIVLNCNGSSTALSAKAVHLLVPVAPGSYPKGLEVRLCDKDRRMMELSTGPVDLKAGEVKSIPVEYRPEEDLVWFEGFDTFVWGGDVMAGGKGTGYAPDGDKMGNDGGAKRDGFADAFTPVAYDNPGTGFIQSNNWEEVSGKTVDASHILSDSYVKSRNIADWTYFFRSKEWPGYVSVGYGNSGRGIVRTPSIGNLEKTGSITVSFDLCFQPGATDDFLLQVIGGGLIRSAKVDGRDAGIVPTYAGITSSAVFPLSLVPATQSLDQPKTWHRFEVSVDRATDGTSFYFAGNTSTSGKHGFWLDNIKVLKGEDTPRKGNLRVLYWNIQDGMWADQAANYNNFVKWVKRYDPDICIWCEAASIYRTGTDISAPTAERFLPDGWPALAARYGHSYYALSGKRDNFPQEITSKYPVTTLLKITDTDVSGKPVAHGAAIQQVEVNGRKINFVTCHMWPQGYGFGVTGEDAQEASKAAHEGDYHRRFEMQYIIDHTVNDPEYANEDWILVGDMNSRSRKDNWYYGYADDSTVLITQDVVLRQTNLLDIIAETWPGTFCSSTYGNARIDFMYASPSMMTRVVDAGFVLDKWTIPHKTPYFYDPSDHRPILVDFQL